jgi:hypothetical protein
MVPRPNWKGYLKLSLVSSASMINIGFVAAEHTGRSVAIRLRPAVASGAALASLFYWLSGQTADRFLVSSFEDMDWRHALMSSRNDAMAHVSRLPRLS